MCAVKVENIKLRFAQVERLVDAMHTLSSASDASGIYRAFWNEYEDESRFVYSEIGMRDVGE